MNNPGTTVIRSNSLIDGKSASPIRNAVVVLKGPLIVAVGTAEEMEVPRGPDVGRLLPGLLRDQRGHRDRRLRRRA